MSAAKETNPAGQKGSDAAVGPIVVGLIVAGVIYYAIDESLFARHRPWNLLLFLATAAAAIGSLTCFVLVLMRMCKSENDRVLAIVSGVLVPVCGLGSLVAFIWGWVKASQTDHKDIQDRETLELTMKWWTGCIAVSVAVLAYVWYNAPPPPRVPNYPVAPVYSTPYSNGYDGYR